MRIQRLTYVDPAFELMDFSQMQIICTSSSDASASTEDFTITDAVDFDE